MFTFSSQSESGTTENYESIQFLDGSGGSVTVMDFPPGFDFNQSVLQAAYFFYSITLAGNPI